MQKILVTGAAGFIGYHLCQRLLAEGYHVIGLDIINDYYDTGLKYSRLNNLGIQHISAANTVEHGVPGFEFVQTDVADAVMMQKLFALEKPDAIVHLAAQAGVRYSIENPSAYLKSNVDGFLQIIEGCRHHVPKHLIFASTSSVYGLNEKYPFEEDQNTDHPISLYSATKKSNELMAHVYSHLFQIPITGLRFFTVYGPWGRPDMALFLFTRNILEEKPIQVFNHGQMIRDFTYVGDIVESIVRLIPLPPKANPDYDKSAVPSSSSTAPYRIYNIGNNEPVNLMDFVKEIEYCTGKKAILDFMPIQPGDVSKTYADSSSLYSAIGFKPSTTIAEGIKAFTDWYMKYYNIPS